MVWPEAANLTGVSLRLALPLPLSLSLNNSQTTSLSQGESVYQLSSCQDMLPSSWLNNHRDLLRNVNGETEKENEK